MASLFDLLPASPWSPQPFPLSLEQTPPPAPADRMPTLPPLHELSRQPFIAPPTAWREPEGSELLPTVVAAPAPESNPLGGILGLLFGAKKEDASAPSLQSSSQYGVVPKNFPAEYRLPPPISDWQRPESEFTFPLDSPHTLGLIQKSLAAGLPPDRIVLNDTTARLRRDNARMADLLFPGSGNFVSGDWSNITDGDIANLLFSVASTVLPPARAAGPARTVIRGVRAAAEAEATAHAAQAAGVRAITAGAAPVAGEIDAPMQAANALQLMGQDHHGISKKIHRALEKHMNLRGLYEYRDPRFVTRAIDRDAHRGYQRWHRQLDSEIEDHILASPEMTPQDFEEFLRTRYREPDLIARFPNGL